MRKYIEELIKKIKESFKILAWGIQGSETPGTPVMAGLDAIVKLEGKTVAYATNVSFDEDFELQGIRTLGFHGDRDFKSMGYTLTITVGTFVLAGENVADNLLTPTRQAILTSGLVDFELIDVKTKKTLYMLLQCKCSSTGVAFESGSLATKNTTWRGREVKPMSVS